MEIVVRVREEIYLIYGRRIKNIITIYIYIYLIIDTELYNITECKIESNRN